MKLYSPKTIKINESYFVHFFYSNNRGNGDNNVSVSVTTLSDRSEVSQLTKRSGREKTSGFAGLVNVSKKLCRDLGIDYDALKTEAKKIGILR
jgi:hypothetical protein